MLKIEREAALAAADTVVVPRRGILPKFLRMNAAVPYSGLCRSLIYQHLNKGDIKSHRVGGVRLIDRESLDAFIQSHAA